MHGFDHSRCREINLTMPEHWCSCSVLKVSQTMSGTQEGSVALSERDIYACRKSLYSHGLGRQG